MRTRISVVMLLVLALRSLLPAGFMVQAASAASEGAFEIVICTSSGLQVMTVDGEGSAPPAKPQHVDSGLCPFSAGGAAALADAAAPSLVGTAEYAAVTYTLAVALFSETPKPGATSARGPPSSLV